MRDLRYKEFNPLKVLHHIDRLKSLAQGEEIAPVTIEIDPVAYCNHACAWCVDPQHYPYQLSLEMYTKLIDELANFTVNNFKVEGVVLKGGGEPSLHPEFATILTLAAQQGFAVGIVTNGSRLAQHHEVVAKYANYVRISIDGPTPESHYAIHQRKDFQAIIGGIKQLVAARGQHRHPIIGLSFAMDIHTYQLAAQAIELGEALHVDYILIRPPFFEEVGSMPTMTITQAQTVRQHLQKVASEYVGTLQIFVGNWVSDSEQQFLHKKIMIGSSRRDLQVTDQQPIEHRTRRCLASPILAVITADGSLYGCCNLRALPQWSFGKLDYACGIGFQQLWEGEKRKQVLSQMHQTKCLKHCTHPLSKYNEIIEVMQDQAKWHSQFV